MGESKLLLALFCNKILTKSEQGVVVVVISWRSGCVTLTVTLQLYRGGECDDGTAASAGHALLYQVAVAVPEFFVVCHPWVVVSSEVVTQLVTHGVVAEGT